MYGIGNISQTLNDILSPNAGLGKLPPMRSAVGNAFVIDYVPLSEIYTDEKNFQTGGYGSKHGQYFNFTSLNDRLQKLYAKNVQREDRRDVNGEYTEPFQIAAYKLSSSDLDKVQDLKKIVDAAYKELKNGIKYVRDAKIPPYINGAENIKTRIVDGLGKPTIKLEFEDNAELLNFQNAINNALPYEAAPMQVNAQGELEPLSGHTVNDKPAAVFNCPESELDCRGYKPTYKRLADYSHLIDAADGAKTLKGYGFEKSTLDELVNACKQYKQVERLAAHLKDDDKMQSAFNIWHWLHTNINYNYDTPGEEEIRTPARTWADRNSGVDCDCLAVFTACLLLNMGYNPCFEIVAFNNSPKFSHIYVNLDGAAIDRVLPVFLQRPANITKTKIMEIPVYELSGVGRCDNSLSGVYNSTLAKIQSGTASGDDNNNYRKMQVLVTLKGIDDASAKLAALLMPYVLTVGDDGVYYFDNSNVAALAKKLDAELKALKIQGADDTMISNWLSQAATQLKNASGTPDGEDTIVIIINPKGDSTNVQGKMVSTNLQTLSPMSQDAIAQSNNAASSSTLPAVMQTTAAPQEESSGNSTVWWLVGGLVLGLGLSAMAKRR